MTVPRVFRGNLGGQFEIRVSPPGIDATTATPEQLLLHITSQTSQIVKQGVVAPPFPQPVPHTIGFAPVVIINMISTGLVAGFGYVRPFDNTWAPWVFSSVESGATELVFKQSTPVVPGPASATPLPINYFVINAVAP